MPKAKSFNADEKTRELLEADITIGGETFRPARLTPDVRRDQIAIATNSAKLARKAGLDRDATKGDEITDAQLDKRVEVIGDIDQGVYEQLVVLIRDEDNKPPPLQFLKDNLDHRVAGELLSWLLQDDDEDGQPGEPTVAATPAGSTT